MAKDFVTAHIKMEDEHWQQIGARASNHDLSTAQLIRKILQGWLDSQVIVLVGPEGDGPWSAQQLGEHSGFNPHSWTTRSEFLAATAEETITNPYPDLPLFSAMPVDSVWRRVQWGDDDSSDTVVVAHDRLGGRVIVRMVNDYPVGTGPYDSLQYVYHGITIREFETWTMKMYKRIS